MRTYRFAALVCGLLFAVGCRANNSTVLLERDLRLQEDKIYHLQSCLDDACAAREATIRENDALKAELAGGDRGAGSDAGPTTTPSRDLRAPSVELPDSKESTPDLTPPVIELPGSSDAPSVEPAPGGKQTVIEAPPTQLVINKRLTGGLDRDGHGGDEGILVVFEPRDAAGHLVKWPGAVSVVLMDPALEGAASRVARWDFAEPEVPAHFYNTAFGRGLQFELPWPNRPPQNKELVLFVRFTTDDGRKLTSDIPIEIRPPDDAGPVDRQTKRSRSERAEREPRSRVKSSGRRDEAPRATRAPADTDAAEHSPDDDEHEVVSHEEEETPRQATRPEWKPFR